MKPLSFKDGPPLTNTWVMNWISQLQALCPHKSIQLSWDTIFYSPLDLRNDFLGFEGFNGR